MNQEMVDRIISFSIHNEINRNVSLYHWVLFGGEPFLMEFSLGYLMFLKT